MEEERVRVRFFTKVVQFRVPDAPFAIPSKLGRYGLSEIINHLLALENPQPFDFIIHDKLLRSPLNKFIQSHHLSVEGVINIEFTPSISFSDDSNSLEIPSWVGCLTTKLDPFIVTGCYDGQIQLIDKSKLNIINSTQAHELPVRDIVGWRTSSNNNCIATSSKDNLIKCWTIESDSHSKSQYLLSQIGLLNGHRNSVESLEISNDNHHLISGDWSGNILIWDIKNLANNNDDSTLEIKKKKRKNNNTNSQSNHSTTTTLVEMKSLHTIKAHNQSITSLQFTQDTNQRFYSSSWDHTIKEWDFERQDCIATFGGSKVITSLDYSDKTHLLATSHPDGRIRLWDSRQREDAVIKASYTSSKQWISQVKWQPHEVNYFSVIDYEGKLQLWDVRANIPLSTMEAHSGKGLCLDWIVSSSSTNCSNSSSNSNDKESNMDGNNNDRPVVISGGSDCCIKATCLA